MKLKLIGGLRLAILAMAISLFSLPSHAEGQIDLKPYVSASASYDDNLFRLASKSDALAILGSDKMSDRFYRTDAGINVDWAISRQHLLLELNLNQNDFDHFSFLNNDGYAYKIGWEWQIGNHLAGLLSLREDRSMAGFSEIQNPVLNLRTRTSKLASLNWDFHPRWRLRALREETDFSNSDISYRASDRSELAYEVGIQYATPKGSRIGLSMRQTDSAYDARDAFSLFFFGNTNRQRELALDGTWDLTGKTRIQARIAKVEREYEEAPERNFDGWAGSANINWQATGKLSLVASATRNIYAIDDLQASFVQSDIWSLSPSWAITSKLYLQASASYEERSYLGDPAFVFLGASQREDKIKAGNLSLRYVPYPKVNLQLIWQKESRDSNASGIGYQDNTLTSNLRVDF